MGELVELRTFQLTQITIPLKELRKWRLFDTIGDGFLQNVRLAHAFVDLGFLVNTDDDVYGFGTGLKGCLGCGSITKTAIPVRIDPLCGQAVKDFVISLNERKCSCFAITEDGRVFAWGDNSYGQLGIGTNDALMSTPPLIKFDDGVKIDKIAVGYGHTLALTKDTGAVFSWGRNYFDQLGLGNNTYQNKPCKVTTNLGSISVKQISCSRFSSFALSESGDVYSWGSNCYGQLGMGYVASINVPTKLITDKPIKKIANGGAHTLLLTTSGEIYVCGYNGQEQLGTGDTINLSVPTKLSGDLGIFDDISCTPFTHRSSAKSAYRVFVWGEIYDEITCSKPKELETNLSNFPHHPRLFKGTAQIMCKSLCALDYAEDAVTIPETLLAIDGAWTDVTFKVDGDLIRAHKYVLASRSDYFSKQFAKDWKQQESPIALHDMKRDTFHALLYYVYTGNLYFSDAEVDQILDLMKLAVTFCETGLKGKCESVLRKQMTLENVFTIYEAVEDCQAKNLRDVAFNFVVRNWMEISNTGLLDKVDLSKEDLKQFTKAWAAKCKDGGGAGNSNK